MGKFGISAGEIWQQLKMLRTNIRVKTKFKDQVSQIDHLLSNDKTGMVSTVLDFMIHSATVDMKIETQNDTLNDFLKKWQTRILNRDANIDIPGGLRALSTENFRERWRSSLLALKVQWGEEDFGNNGTFIVPKRMWFVDGGAITTKSNGSLNTRQFFLRVNKEKTIELKQKVNESIFIRKPYTAWHKDVVTPYLVKRGTVFNALMKNAITQKQSDVIEAIMPILLQLKAGNDELALQGLNPSEEDYKKLKDKFVEAKEKFESGGNFGDIIASLRHDVNLDYLIPDLTKIFDEKIVRSTDRNLLASLGLIELVGFSSTREEAILNPKVLVEEVTDAVSDWANLLQDVMIEMMKRNKANHRNLADNEIQVIPGTIKAFLTDEMRSMLRSMFDRGVVSHQNATEDIANMNFEVQLNRNKREDKNNVTDIMTPPLIQNLGESNENEEMDDNNLEDQDKKPNTPEADNFNKALLEHYGRKHKKKTKKKTDKTYSEEQEPVTSFENIDQLSQTIKSTLSVPAQLLWLKTYNSTYKTTEDVERSLTKAWEKVSEIYEEVEEGSIWVKKEKLEDYKAQMSSYAYNLFGDLYNTSVTQGSTHTNAIQTALAIIQRTCTKNAQGKWVKDKKITKATLEKIDRPDFVSSMLECELTEHKIQLIKKLLENN